MNSVRTITVIPSAINLHSPSPMALAIKKRVAAYARVSTDNAEQLSSYEAQVDYYTRYIKGKDEWEFVDIYTDEGISGTSMKNREGFKHMIADALEGKIDLILTKSVSRFARNTVDTLTTVRQLKEKNVEVYFEKENIYTLDTKGELLITIMSSLAQEESRNISLNTTWGQRKRFADGKINLPYKAFLGYEKGPDGLPQIVEDQAKIVRLIYQLFLEGKTPTGIARYLTSCNIPTPASRKNWTGSTVTSILTNEKYKGDAILQKTYTEDFLTKKIKVNNGEIQMYYIENSHSAIVSPETYELVQEEFRRRKAAGNCTSAINCFASRIVCGDCGGFYGRKTWHAGSKYASRVWHCNNKFEKRKYCSTPHLKEETVKKIFTDAFNSLIKNKVEILYGYDAIIAQVTDVTNLKKECKQIEDRCLEIQAAVEKLISRNTSSSIDQSEYNQKYTAYVSQYNELQNRLHELNSEITMNKAKAIQMKKFVSLLKKQDNLLTEFDEPLWCAVVNALVVKSDHDVVFQWKDGTELPWKI